MVHRLQSSKLRSHKERTALRKPRQNSILSSPQPLDDFHRCEKRFLSHPTSPKCQKISPLLSRRLHLPIQYPTLRRFQRTCNLVKSLRRNHQIPPLFRNPNHSLHGRYVDMSPKPSNLPHPHSNSHRHPDTSRNHHQLRKVISNSLPVPDPHRLHIRHSSKPSTPTHSKTPRPIQVRKVTTEKHAPLSKKPRSIHRQVICLSPSLPSSHFQTPSTRRRPPSLALSLSKRLGRPSNPLFALHQTAQVLRQPNPDQKIQRKTPLQPQSNLVPNYRRIPLRLGRLTRAPSLRRHTHQQRSIFHRRAESQLKLERNYRHHTRLLLIQRSCSQRTRSSSLPYRQHHRTLLPKAHGRLQPTPPSSHRTFDQILSTSRSSHDRRSHSRKEQSTCRRSIPFKEKRPRLLPRSQPLQIPRHSLRPTHNRSLRLSTKPSNSQVCLMVPRPKSHIQRLVLAELVPREPLCLPADSPHSESSLQVHSLQSPEPDSNSSQLAESYLVADSPTPLQLNPHSPSTLSNSNRQSHLISQCLSQYDIHCLSPHYTFISDSFSPKLIKAREKTYSRFRQFICSHNLPEDENSLLLFVRSAILPSTNSFQSIQSILSQIDVSRRMINLPPLQSHPLVKEFKKAIRRLLPARVSTTDFLDLATVLRKIKSMPPLLPTVLFKFQSQEMRLVRHSIIERIKQNRLRCLILTRTTALLRSIDCATIKRSSIRSSLDPLHRPIVIFNYKGKAASISNTDFESNYLEFLPSDPDLCPASAMLLLKSTIDGLNPPHDFLFCSQKKPFNPLSSERLSSITKGLFSKLGLNSHKSHSIRKAANDLLRFNGVPDADRDTRGGWKPKNSSTSNTQRLCYTHRFSRFNFAEVISRALEFNSSKVTKEISAADEQPKAAKSSGQSPSNL